MKYIISESQYKLLVEQSMIGWSEGVPSGNKEEIVKGWRDSIKKNALGYEKSHFGLNVDDSINLVSGFLEVIPGIGNLISLGIDVIHGLSYYVRVLLSSNTSVKVENFLLGTLSIISAMVPAGGNVSMAVARPTISQVLRMTPQEVLLVLREMGFKVPNSFSKGWDWKLAVLLALIRMYGRDVVEDLIRVVSYLESLEAKYTVIRKITNPVVSILREFISFLETSKT